MVKSMPFLPKGKEQITVLLFSMHYNHFITKVPIFTKWVTKLNPASTNAGVPVKSKENVTEQVWLVQKIMLPNDSPPPFLKYQRY